MLVFLLAAAPLAFSWHLNLELLDGFSPESAGKPMFIRHYSTEAVRKLHVHLDGQPLSAVAVRRMAH